MQVFNCYLCRVRTYIVAKLYWIIIERMVQNLKRAKQTCQIEIYVIPSNPITTFDIIPGDMRHFILDMNT